MPAWRTSANKADKSTAAGRRLLSSVRDESRRQRPTAVDPRQVRRFQRRLPARRQIAFLSTRKGIPLQCTKANTVATTQADLPDSYVRCGGGNGRPVPVFTLHAMDAEGTNLHPISAFENFEWTPVGGQRRPHPVHPLGLHRPFQRPFLQPLVDEPRRHEPAARLRQLHGASAGEDRGPLRCPARRRSS